jgi:hypothetical protein
MRQICREFENIQFRDRAYNHLKFTKSPNKSKGQGRRATQSTPPSSQHISTDINTVDNSSKAGKSKNNHINDNKLAIPIKSDDNERAWTKVPMPSVSRLTRIT